MVKAILYSTKYNYCIECSPKCGSRLLRHLFYALHRSEQPTLSAEEWRHFYVYFKPPSKEAIRDCPKLVLTRNPYTRILSAFLNKYVNASETKILKTKLNQHGLHLQSTTFYQFLQAVQTLKIRGKLNTVDEHIEEQFNTLILDSNTKLIQLEAIQTDLSKAYRTFPSLEPLADQVQELVTALQNDALASNKTIIKDKYYEHPSDDFAVYRWTGKETDFPPYWHFFVNPKVRELIYDLYQRDFETLGYTKDSYPRKPIV